MGEAWTLEVRWSDLSVALPIDSRDLLLNLAESRGLPSTLILRGLLRLALELLLVDLRILPFIILLSQRGLHKGTVILILQLTDHFMDGGHIHATIDRAEHALRLLRVLRWLLDLLDLLLLLRVTGLLHDEAHTTHPGIRFFLSIQTSCDL